MTSFPVKPTFTSEEKRELGIVAFFLDHRIFFFKGGGKHTVIFRNKRSQAKGVCYVFLYKQHLYNVYTPVAIHSFALGSLVVGQSLSSPPQFWISTLARDYQANLSLWLTNAEPIVSPYPCSPARFSLSLSLSLLWTGRVSVS